MNSKYSALVSFLSTTTAAFPATGQPAISPPKESFIPTSKTTRSSLRTMEAILSPAPSFAPMGVYVGELQEKWQFPSDHLPIGMSFRDINIASWNVLDSAYMDWVIEKNSQGLSRSMIADTHVYIGDSELTIRDQIIANRVLEMVYLPQQIISLQECSDAFLQELESRLPTHMQLIAHDGNAMLIDRTQFQVESAQAITGVFSERPHQSFQDITLTCLGTEEKIRLVNVHLPGNTEGPARYEFGKYLIDTATDPTIPVVAMGDMNFNELEMRDAIEQNAPSVPFFIRSPYCTNIDPYTRYSKAIDHFIVFHAEPCELWSKDPNDVLPNLADTAELLLTVGEEMERAESN